MALYLSEQDLASRIGRRPGEVRRAVERGVISADTRADGQFYFRTERLEELRSNLVGPARRDQPASR